MEDASFKSRNILVLLFEVLIIIVAIGGLTFATSRIMRGSSTIITFGEYNVDYVGDTDIVVSDLEPISDSLINYNTYENVIRLEFSLKGVQENDEEDLIYDIMVNDLDIDCSLLNEYTKWNLYKNGELLYNGNFSPLFDGNVLTNNFRLTETQQDFPKYNEEYDNYVLIIWISEACEDLTNCVMVDQSQIVNSVMSMKVFVALSGGEKVLYERVPSNNPICVNKPELYDGMIPVYYDDGEWRIADSTNSDVDKVWYNYGESKWANVVFVNNDKYDNGTPGNIVNQEDIIGYYVWIPRFKYKLWNALDVIEDSYNAYEKGIEIVFESGVHTTGNAICSEGKCGGYNDQYLTHPAFEEDLRGFWISKYEISEGSKFIPNTISLKNESLDSYNSMINTLSNTYGINDNVNSHIITNMEWGATLYLSHSKYGLCSKGSCKSIGMNKSYVSEGNKQDTTTGNVYGIYDMSGASAEYVVGSTGLGSGISEVRINDNTTWYNGSYLNNYKDYTLRGGVEKGLFSVSDIGMFDVSTRSVLVSK